MMEFQMMALLGVACGVVLAVIIILYKNRNDPDKRKPTTIHMARIVSVAPDILAADGGAEDSTADDRAAGDQPATDISVDDERSSDERPADDQPAGEQADGEQTADEQPDSDQFVDEYTADEQELLAGDELAVKRPDDTRTMENVSDQSADEYDPDDQPAAEEPVGESVEEPEEEMVETQSVKASDVLAADVDDAEPPVPAAPTKADVMKPLSPVTAPDEEMKLYKPVTAGTTEEKPSAPAVETIADIIKPTEERPLPKKKRLPDTIRLKARMVLLADDDGVNRDIIAIFFEESGVKFDFAANGKEAYEKFAQEPDKYGMIIMDIEMPEMDGFESARRIRSLDADWAKQIPIVALSGHGNKGDIDKCFDAGMDDHIPKPVDLELLQEKVFEFVSMGME